MRRVLGLVAGVVIVAGIVVVLGRLPSNTGSASLIARAVVGAAIGLIVIVIVRRALRAMAEPPPPTPQTVDVRTAEVVYVCPVCGTRVRLELAATAKAPKHCGEEMEPQVRVNE